MDGKATRAVYEHSLETIRGDSVFDVIDLALKENRIFAAYQPILCLKTGRISAVEALVRVRTVDGKTIEPRHFWAALEDPLFAMKLSDRVLDIALKDLREICNYANALCRCAINVTELQISDPTFVGRLVEKVDLYGVAHESVVLEVTETIALSDKGRKAQSSVKKLSDAGFKLSLDDFGVGFSSLTHLMELDVHQVKVDKLFIQSMETSPRAAAIADTIIQLGRRIGLETVAEGIETPTHESLVRRTGCDFGQGFLYARPMPLEELLIYCREVGWRGQT